MPRRTPGRWGPSSRAVTPDGPNGPQTPGVYWEVKNVRLVNECGVQAGCRVVISTGAYGVTNEILSISKIIPANEAITIQGPFYLAYGDSMQIGSSSSAGNGFIATVNYEEIVL